MHRREGDFSNAKYWYARCADHRALRLISAIARDVAGRDTQDKWILKIVAGEYNPKALVDLVEEIHDHPQDPRFTAAVRLQRMEWEALFNHCVLRSQRNPRGDDLVHSLSPSHGSVPWFCRMYFRVRTCQAANFSASRSVVSF